MNIYLYKMEFTEDRPHDIRVITFNFLSPEITRPEWMPYVKKSHLNFGNRSEKTKKLISSWIRVNFIICIQEMSKSWKRVLEPFFLENNYGFICDMYSSDKMGVGIAYPLKHYDIVDTDLNNCGNIIDPIYKKIIEKNDCENINTELRLASESKNTILSLLLSAKNFGVNINKNFIISTYHMPCQYKLKYYMLSHIHALKIHLENLLLKWNNQYSKTASVIIAGDFNITEKSPEYKFLIGDEKELYINNLDNIYSSIGINIFDGISFKSSHKIIHNKEPKYTNICIQTDKIFVECLDYILINNQIDVRSCTVGLTVPEPLTTPYPNALCPSDHVPLSASLRIR